MCLRWLIQDLSLLLFTLFVHCQVNTCRKILSCSFIYGFSAVLSQFRTDSNLDSLKILHVHDFDLQAWSIVTSSQPASSEGYYARKGYSTAPKPGNLLPLRDIRCQRALCYGRSILKRVVGLEMFSFRPRQAYPAQRRLRIFLRSQYPILWV